MHRQNRIQHRKTSWPAVMVTFICMLSALVLGLSLRFWLPGGPVEAEAKFQAPTPSANPLSSAVPLPSNASTQLDNVPAENQVVTQTVNGVAVSATHFRLETNQLKVNVCFTIHDTADWSIWKASLAYAVDKQTIETADFGGIPLELREFPVNGQQRIITFGLDGEKNISMAMAGAEPTGRRCDTLYFEVQPEADLSNLKLTIHALATYPRESEVCGWYLTKVQKMLDAQQAGIKIQCVAHPTGSRLQIVEKPASMSEAEAENLIYSEEFFTVPGPWVFQASLR